MKLYVCIAIGSGLVGCATTRLYPTCYYNEQPTRESYERSLPALKDALRVSLGKGEDYPVAESPDGRWLVAEANDHENANAAKAWPRIGCIGKATNTNTVRQEADCVEYVVSFVRDENYYAFGKYKDDGGYDIWNESPIRGAVVDCLAIEAARPGESAPVPEEGSDENGS